MSLGVGGGRCWWCLWWLLGVFLVVGTTGGDGAAGWKMKWARFSTAAVLKFKFLPPLPLGYWYLPSLPSSSSSCHFCHHFEGGWDGGGVVAMAEATTIASTPQFSFNFDVGHTATHSIGPTIIINNKLALKVILV